MTIKEDPLTTTVEALKAQISAGKIKFDPPSATSERLKKELLGENEGTKVTELLQKLVLAVSNLVTIQVSSIIRSEGHHKTGRAFDVGNETVAKDLLPTMATDAKVQELGIDEIIFDAGGDTLAKRNKWNYDEGKKHPYDDATLSAHQNHIHFAVKAT